MAYFVRYDDDSVPGCLALTGGNEDPAYPATNARLDNPANPAKSTTTSDRYVAEYATKQQPVLTSLIYAYLDAGLDVRLQANNSNAWGSPALDIPIVIPGKRKDGPTYQRWTINPWAFIELPDPDGYLFWSWYFPSNSQNIIVGKFLLASAVYQVQLLSEGGDLAREKDYDEFSAIRDKTELGVRKVQVLGGPRRFLSGELVGTDYSAGSAPVQDAADFRALLQAAEGDAHPWLWIPFEDRNDAWLVDNEDFAWERSHKVGGYQVWPFAVREVARGLPWP